MLDGTQRTDPTQPSEGTAVEIGMQNLARTAGYADPQRLEWAIGDPRSCRWMTLQAVLFTERGSWQPVPIAQVPPRLFSESMRDVDLVVSVAHMGGVDPEASASTLEMRRALVRETAMLLGHDNVRFANHHSIIEAKLGNYSVHLGSGVVHRQPGGAVCIIPVGSQHRGLLILPFADDDPKTAEVVSKVVMLARDSEIKDPTILEPLVRSSCWDAAEPRGSSPGLQTASPLSQSQDTRGIGIECDLRWARVTGRAFAPDSNRNRLPAIGSGRRAETVVRRSPAGR